MSLSAKSFLRTCLKFHESWRHRVPQILVNPHRTYTGQPHCRLLKKLIYTNKVYLPTGPYTQGVRAGNMIYISGMQGKDEMGTLDPGGICAQTRRALCNLMRVLETECADLRSVVKTTILLSDINDFKIVNEAYEEYFEYDHPARATYQVARLPQGASVEIDAVAIAGRVIVEQMMELY